jgi:hypothetical protein
LRLGVWFALVGALAAFGGCSVGQGSGSATGSLFVVSCNDRKNFGTDGGSNSGYMVGPISYSLGGSHGPSFFAGAPIEDLIQGPGAMNVLQMRMASSGLLERYTDFLEFDVTYSYEVARCVRGRTVNGQPDYLVYAPLPLTLATAANPAPMTLWCDWTGMAFSDGGAPDAAMPGAPDAGTALDGGMSTMASAPRIHLTPYTDVHASLGLYQTCPDGNQAGTGIDGWIEFQSFGTAEQSDFPPDQRMPIGPEFVINFGDRLRARFHVIIGDPRYVTAIETGSTPPTAPVIGGTLDGYFDFDLARGRSAQPFP